MVLCVGVVWGVCVYVWVAWCVGVCGLVCEWFGVCVVCCVCVGRCVWCVCVGGLLCVWFGVCQFLVWCVGGLELRGSQSQVNHNHLIIHNPLFISSRTAHANHTRSIVGTGSTTQFKIILPLI